MDSESRREQILNIISRERSSISASALAKTLNVSRQIIVGDVALLRARGNEIIATARGYMISGFRESNPYLGKIACRHTREDTKSELYTMVDMGATVVNVIVEHELYGEIIGGLNLSDRKDVDVFLEKAELSKAKLLSELTMEAHLHTVACRDKVHFEQVCKALEEKGHLFEN